MNCNNLLKLTKARSISPFSFLLPKYLYFSYKKHVTVATFMFSDGTDKNSYMARLKLINYYNYERMIEE